MTLTQKLHPDNHISPTSANIARILELYGLILQHFALADSGIENTTIFTECTQGRFVLRVYRHDKKPDEHVRNEMNFVKYLQGSGIKVPEIIPSKSGDIFVRVKVDGIVWQAVLMKFIDGRHADVYSETLIEDMAVTQARVHNYSAEYDAGSSNPMLNCLRDEYFSPRIRIDELANSRLKDFVERARKYEVDLSSSLPRGLCHLDYDRENIIVGDDNVIVAVLDFDDLANAPFIVDLAYALWHVRFNEDIVFTKQYLSVYENYRLLSEEEKATINKIMLFRHYAICCLGILEGNTSEAHINKYLLLENELSG